MNFVVCTQHGVSCRTPQCVLVLHNLLLFLVHVDVAAHKIGKERTFGKPASDLWKRHMQTAEGPNAFKKGYHKLMEHFCKDGARRRFIQQLHMEKDRHHFSRELWW